MAQHLYLAGNWAEYLEKSTELIDSVSVSKCGKYFLLLNRARAHLELGSNRICVQDCSDASKLLKSFAPEVVPVRAFDYQIRAYRALQNPQLAERVWSVLRERVEGKQAATVSSIIDLELYSSIKQRCENPGQKLSAVVPSPTSAIVSNGGSLTEKAIPGRLPPRRLVSHLTQGDIALQLKVSEGYQRVNSGDLPQSLIVFNDLLASNPDLEGARIGRGSVFAMQSLYDKAVEDFASVVKNNPANVDAWLRLGQTLAASRRLPEALAALNEPAMQVNQEMKDYPLGGNPKDDALRKLEAGELYYQRAMVFHLLQDEPLAFADIQTALKFSPNNKNYFNTRGVIQNASGETEAALRSFETALKLDTGFRECLINLAQNYRDEGKVEEALKYFARAIAIPSPKNTPLYTNAQDLRGILLYLSGDITKSIEDFSFVLAHTPKHKSSLQMRGTAMASLGQFRKAVVDFDTLLHQNAGHIVFYNRQLALFCHSHLDNPCNSFNFDRSLDAAFKDSFLKRGPPSSISNYKAQPRFGKTLDVDLQAPLRSDQQNLINILSDLYSLVLYDSPGFFANVRQQRMFSVAAAEVGQLCRAHWGLAGNHRNKGVYFTGAASSVSTVAHTCGWRDVMDVCVKWRQFSEPNDPVFWIDLLDEESFKAGFGLQTPIVNGPLKVVRYYPYFNRCFGMLKKLLAKQSDTKYNEEVQGVQLANMKELSELFSFKGTDFYATTDCISSIGAPTMEGTRLTVQRMPGRAGYRFSIRTPGTPERFKRFDDELSHCWNQLSDMMNCHDQTERAEAVANKPISKESVLSLCLRFYFYWVNFGPLSRGTAACGLSVFHGLLLGCGFRCENSLPKGIQLDWEAITTSSPDDFVRFASPLFQLVESYLLEGAPSVSKAFGTIREILRGLNVQ